MVATKSRLEKLDMESGYVGSRLGCKLITGNRATCFSETEPAMKQCKGAKEDESERLRLARLNRRINESLEPVMGTVLLGCKVWWMRMRVGSLIRWWGGVRTMRRKRANPVSGAMGFKAQGSQAGQTSANDFGGACEGA